MKAYFIIFYILFLGFCQGCIPSKNINYYFQQRKEASKEDIFMEISYYKNAPLDKVRKDDEVLLVFNGEAFKNEYVVLNKKDTIHFIESNNNCMGAYLFTQKINSRRVHLSTPKKESVIFRINTKYDYIKINGSSNNKWSIVYSEYFPSIVCE